jgi:spermidine/putrescine transport system ATP-binding protein
MQFELKRIQREVGITFVHVTHDQEEALAMSDRLAVMNEGRVEQVGAPAEIYDRPATAFVAGFIGRANLWPATVRDRVGDQATVSALGAPAIAAACHAPALGAGDAGTLMVRPERIRVHAAPPTDTRSAVEVTVADLVFQGPLVRAVLHAAGGEVVVADLPHRSEAPPLRPGDRAWAAWTADAALVLPASPTATPDPTVAPD